jgi:chorismate mutase/prephenate dehydratase
MAAEAKRAAGNHELYRPEREAQVLRRVAESNPGPLSEADVTHLFREIMSACLALEAPLKIAYLGPEGTYTQTAAQKHFGHFAETCPVAGVEQVFREVEAGTCDYGVVPIENSIEGVVTHTLDTFAGSNLQICGEIELPIHHKLLSHAPDAQAIHEVFAHPQAFAQCRAWLDEHLPQALRVPVTSNAEGARRAAGLPATAAIASQAASELYGLPCLAHNIETTPDNTTRFLILGKRSPQASGRDKTSMIFTIPNQPGALHQVLAVLGAHGINMTHIESRPLKRGKWAYSFFLEIEGHGADASVAQALKEVEARVSNFRLLGSYPRA